MWSLILIKKQGLEMLSIPKNTVSPTGAVGDESRDTRWCGPLLRSLRGRGLTSSRSSLGPRVPHVPLCAQLTDLIWHQPDIQHKYRAGAGARRPCS